MYHFPRHELLYHAIIQQNQNFDGIKIEAKIELRWGKNPIGGAKNNYLCSKFAGCEAVIFFFGQRVFFDFFSAIERIFFQGAETNFRKSNQTIFCGVVLALSVCSPGDSTGTSPNNNSNFNLIIVYYRPPPSGQKKPSQFWVALNETGEARISRVGPTGRGDALS